MSCRSRLPFVLLLGCLTGCGASVSRAEVGTSELRARSAQAEARREHARLVELEARLVELEQRLARRSRACEVAPEPQPAEVVSAREPPKTDPHRSQGDFLTEAHAATPAAPPAPLKVAVAAPPPPAPAASEREQLEQLLQGLREYGFDTQSGLSLERREALRVLLRRERQLDLMNPWDGH